MNAVHEPTQDEIDAALERDIEAAYDRFNAATTIAERRATWERLKALIKRRSPTQVAKLEAIRKLLPDSWTVTVCSACLHASCWQGEFRCMDSAGAGTREMNIGALRTLAKQHEHWEHEDWWGKDESVRERLANLGIHDTNS
jgi:hypothetical protein